MAVSRGFFVVLLAAALAASACSSESSSLSLAPSAVVIPPSTVPTTGATLVVSVVGPTIPEVQLTLSPEGMTKMVSVPDSTQFRGVSPGPHKLTATKDGRQVGLWEGEVPTDGAEVTLPVTPIPTPGPEPGPVSVPWSDLPPLSDAARNFIVNYNLNVSSYQGGNVEVGATKRWASGVPIHIYADPRFRAQDLTDAIGLVQSATGNKVTFQVTSGPASAHVVFDFVWPPPGGYAVPDTACGVEGPDRVKNNVILSGFGHYASRPECSPGGDWKIGLAHGLFHILGLGGHTESGSDVLGAPSSVWGTSPLLREIANWLYSVPPGTRPV